MYVAPSCDPQRVGEGYIAMPPGGGIHTIKIRARLIEATRNLPNFGLMCSLILLLSLRMVAGFFPLSRAEYSSHNSATVIPVRSAILVASVIDSVAFF